MGAKKVQTRHYDADNDLEATEDLNKYVSKDVVATAINAWREFKTSLMPAKEIIFIMVSIKQILLEA